MQQSTACLHFAWRTTSLRVGGLAARRSCLPGLRRDGGGRQAGAAVLSCLVWRCELAFRPPGSLNSSVTHARACLAYTEQVYRPSGRMAETYAGRDGTDGRTDTRTLLNAFRYVRSQRNNSILIIQQIALYRGSAGFWLWGSMPPLPPEAKKILKI